MVGEAGIHGGKSAVLLMKMLKYLMIPLQVILADGDYRGDIIEEVKAKSGYIIQIVMREMAKKTKSLNPLIKDGLLNVLFPGLIRRLCRNYELLMETSESMVKLSAVKLLLNKNLNRP